ncbi:MAG: hypothetical protein RR967_02355 [Anaerovoracaceae bacterium]
MGVSINVENGAMRLVIGELVKDHLEIDGAWVVEFATEVVMNGIIIDETAFSFALNQLVDKAKGEGFEVENVRILITGTPALTKVKNIPKLKKAEMQKWMADEFVDQNEGGKEQIYDYQVIEYSKEEGCKVILCSIEKNVISQYVDIFHQAGISIGSIDLGLTCQAKLIRTVEALKDENFIVLHLDGTTLDGALYIDGKFFAQNRKRLLGEKGSVEMLNEIKEMISRLLQFAHGNVESGVAESIKTIYITGFEHESENIKLLRESGYIALNLVDALDRQKVEDNYGIDFNDYVYTIANLIGE